MNRFLPIVGVMGSGQHSQEEWATPLGQFLSSKSVHILTGGGQGVMSSVSKAFCENENRKGLCLGVVPSEPKQGEEGFSNKAGYPNPYVELEINSPLGTFAGSDVRMISRNHINIMTSHAIVALPGSGGTLNEVNISLWLKKPIIMFGPEEKFTSFPSEVERTQDIDRVDSFLDEVLNYESKVS